MFIAMPPEFYEYTYYAMIITVIFGLSFMYGLVVYEFDEKLSTFFKICKNFISSLSNPNKGCTFW